MLLQLRLRSELVLLQQLLHELVLVEHRLLQRWLGHATKVDGHVGQPFKVDVEVVVEAGLRDTKLRRQEAGHRAGCAEVEG